MAGTVGAAIVEWHGCPMPLALSKENPVRTTLALGEVLVDGALGERYRVTGFIGRGGMGEVYLGEAEVSGLVVAIKTIPLALVNDPKIAWRTRFESDALRQLRHPNVVPVYASGVRQDGVMFMVMKYLPGMTLLDLRWTHGRIPIAWSLEIVRDVCRGLSAIHEHAVHRDVKPANLHFGADAIVRVLDLGAAKWKRSGMRLTSVGTQLGTLRYMAPEALDESAPIDAQADLWSVGVVLYELLADRNPFAFDGTLPENPFTLGNRILDDLHVPLRDIAPLCPGYLARIVDRALAKDPRQRHGSAAELEAALSEAMRAFAQEHGASPPLEALAAQTFPGAPRGALAESAARKASGGAAPDLSHLARTALLPPDSVRAQPSALPYIRTEGIGPSMVAAAVRSLGVPIPGVGEPTAPAAPPPQGGRSSEPEPPRVSDVYPKRPPPPTLKDMAASPPVTVRDAALPGAEAPVPVARPVEAIVAPPNPVSAPGPGRRAGALPSMRAIAVTAGVLWAIAFGIVAAALLGWFDAAGPAGVDAARQGAGSAAPSTSSAPRRSPAGRSGR